MVPQQLYGWRRGLRKSEAIGFVPLALESPQADGSGPPSSIGSSEIVVRASGMTIHIPGGVSADHIERVLLAVRVSA
jgi:transposase